VSQSRDLPVIGVVGGIGSGKSAVSRALADRRPVVIIDADKIGHDLLHDQHVKEQLKTEFGASIFDDADSVSRPALAEVVFGETEQHNASRETLNSILHPRIRIEVKRRISEAENDGRTVAVILDAALMLETGWSENCDKIVFIDVPEQTRLKRVVENRNWTEAEFRKREGNQFSTDKKKQLSDHILDNSTTLEDAGAAFEKVLEDILSNFSS
jgi:dephospho-CoA kinase